MLRLVLVLTLPIAWLTLPSRPEAQPGGARVAERHAGVQRSLVLLQASADTWLQRRSCSSCHHQGLGLLAVAVARERGFAVDERLAQVQMARTLLPPPNWLERAVLGEISINEPIGQSYRLLGVGAAGGTRTAVTDALVHLLAGKQHISGAWPSGSHRPPLEDSGFTATATTVRALTLFPAPNRRAEFSVRITHARRWLGTASPGSTEDRVMQLLGLAWAGLPASALQPYAKALLREQRADGGWAQIPTRESDSYATGQVLVALNQAARLAPSDDAWQRGVAFLLASQREDGSWRVLTRRTGASGLPYFESGYPHGKDQFISYAGGAWATIALMLADRDAMSPAIIGQPLARGPATTDVPAPTGLTPLMRAAFDGSPADFDRALSRARNLDAASPLGLTALMFAAHEPQKVKRLLAAGASARRTTNAGHTALLLAAGYDGAGESVDLLLQRGSPIDDAPTQGLLEGLPALGRAALRGDTRVADRLLRAGATIGGAGTRVVSPVLVAAWIGDANLVTWLAGQGADMSVTGPGGADALMVASEGGQTAVVQALLAHGAQVNAVNAEGYSALHLAAQGVDFGDTRIIDLLLGAGADPARTTPDGVTPAALADRWGKPHVVARLRAR